MFVPTVDKDVAAYLYWAERAGGAKIALLSPAFLLYAWRAVAVQGTDKIPTSGMLGVLWAVEACDHVDVYGIGYYRAVAACEPDEECGRSVKVLACTLGVLLHAL